MTGAVAIFEILSHFVEVFVTHVYHGSAVDRFAFLVGEIVSGKKSIFVPKYLYKRLRQVDPITHEPSPEGIIGWVCLKSCI
jgi:hypothetical protein